MTGPLESRLASLDGRLLTAIVPATSAHLGAGYGCLAVALDLVDRITVEVVARREAAVELEVDGEGAGEIASDRTNRFVVALERGLQEAGVDTAGVGWRIVMRNQVPVGRGLGSSTAATVGGLAIANHLSAGRLPVTRLLRLAADIEGRLDGAAAALLGGFVVVDAADPQLPTARFDPPRDVRAVLFVPEQRLRADELQAVLPATVPVADAVANLGRLGLGVAGLAQGRTDLLGVLTVDRLHEPYLTGVFPQLPRLVEAAREAGALGASLSGAGSTLIAFSDTMAAIARIEAAFAATAADLDLPGRVVLAGLRSDGARVTEGD